jgi:hypothetical protein
VKLEAIVKVDFLSCLIHTRFRRHKFLTSHASVGGRCRTRGTKHSEYCGHCEEFQAQIVLTIRNSKLTQLNIASSFFVVGKKHAFSKDCEYSLS